MQPVLEAGPADGFALWPAAEAEPFGFFAINGELTPAEIGTALMCVASCNDLDPEPDGRPPRPADPIGAFLHGLLTFDTVFAAGGLEVVDSASGVTVLPGCCSGLEEWRDWYDVLDGGGSAGFGHDPDARAERQGDTVRIFRDVSQDDGPVIELPADELRRLLSGVERDLTGFRDSAAGWLSRQLPGHAAATTAAIERALGLPPA
ncbi:hypothetical protein LZ318_37785 [Saccharopolyspora indica]|uniref:hypothetical protein n=1 Tax=Saccharopolyspora indica TaxID=1229659 RepID=UPI0022EB0D2A|nr:hypothetical protein [Saccharopolyspora indica]MDA3642891.1 hypothetical protein [Saccharopolyspora indica]